MRARVYCVIVGRRVVLPFERAHDQPASHYTRTVTPSSDHGYHTTE